MALQEEITLKLEELEEAAQEKNDAATEVHTYLTENYTRYLNELLAHIFEGSAEADRDTLIATALKPFLHDAFLADVLRLNTELMEAMTKKMAAISASVNDVKGGIDLEHQHDKDGRVTVGKNGEAVVLQEATVGFDSEALNIGDQLTDDLMDIQSE
jgi:hypothetical protein